MKWMRGGAKRQCDRTLSAPPSASCSRQPPRPCGRRHSWRPARSPPAPRVISDCHFAVQLKHFIPGFSKVTIGYYPTRTSASTNSVRSVHSQATCKAVQPSTERTAFTSTGFSTRASNNRITSSRPFMAAHISGVSPSWSTRLGSAPASSSSRVASRSPCVGEKVVGGRRSVGVRSQKGCKM